MAFQFLGATDTLTVKTQVRYPQRCHRLLFRVLGILCGLHGSFWVVQDGFLDTGERAFEEIG